MPLLTLSNKLPIAGGPTRKLDGGPFIFIATNRFKTGKVEAERHHVPGLVDFIEANEPRLLAFNEYVNDEETKVGVVQVHPDAECCGGQPGEEFNTP